MDDSDVDLVLVSDDITLAINDELPTFMHEKRLGIVRTKKF
ncbi:MAG: hypothetical protein O2864_00635 [Crenarchaeota archaeon]|nr:hypothetical protein [Thermoproteota archaeon]